MLTPDLSDSFGAASFGRLAANHLWQSTAFAAVAVLLALALKGNRARVRHWLWLTASVKLLIPFSVLASIGGVFGRWLVGRWVIPAAPISRLPLAMEQMVQPFAPIQGAGLAGTSPVQTPATPGLLLALLLVFWLFGFVAVLLYGYVRWRRVANAVRCSTPITEGRELEALRRIDWSGSSGLHRRLPRLVSSTAELEPGVFGIFRPILWLPAGIADHLEDAELGAILAHELCHIRRRDGLTAIVHMAVEAIFWFHPLVWWLGTRLTEERERACDEEVVRMGGDPHVYAESILKVCEFYVASPVACVAGVTGGELKKRIEDIMMNRFGRNLSLGKKLILTAVAAVAVTGPFVFGIVSAKAQVDLRNAPRFELVSVRLQHGQTGGAWDKLPVNGRWTSKAMEIPALFVYAYGISYNRVEGVPKALQGPDPGFTIEARMPVTTSRKDFFLMMQSLLADRFKAVVHTEVRDVPANTIEVAKSGVKLKPASGQCVEDAGNTALPEGQHRCHQFDVRVEGLQDGTIIWDYSGWSVSMADLAAELSPTTTVGLLVDDTGLSGRYDFDVKLETHPGQDALENRTNWEYDWRNAWEKQAGLLIDLSKTKKRPGSVVVVDHVELPTPN
jgi:bla regulator protein BlaR1